MSGKILINPAPSDRKCQRCGKHISELKPFGKEGDPLVGNFDGALLVKTFRSLIEPTEELDKKYEDISNDLKEWTEQEIDFVIKKYGENFFNEYNNYSEFTNQVGSSWECRDCIIK